MPKKGHCEEADNCRTESGARVARRRLSQAGDQPGDVDLWKKQYAGLAQELREVAGRRTGG